MVEASPLSETEKQWLHNFEQKIETLGGRRTFITKFLDPRQLELAEAVLRRENGLSYTVYGGYPEAERNILQIFPSQQKTRLPGLEAVQVSWKSPVDQVGHRDMLGAVLALGLKRDQIGDIIITNDNMAVVIVAATWADYISVNLAEVGHTKVKCEPVTIGQLPLPKDDGREIGGTVASLRLDAVVSLGFKLPRSRVVMLVKAGLASVNWRPVNSPAFQLKEGDQVSLKGRGRLTVEAVEGETRKGRIHLKLKRYG
jgi:RNA-binding protein YlmH